MTTAQMRAAVHNAYSGNGWGHKVDNMSDLQVQAVYFSLLERGVFERVEIDRYAKKPVKPTKQPVEPEQSVFKSYTGEQISLF